MNKQINISDNYNAHDNVGTSPVKGVVRIYDDHGILVAESHNMVVKTGRKLLYDLFNSMVAAYSTSKAEEDTTLTVSEDIASNISGIKLNFSYLTEGIKTTSDLTYNLMVAQQIQNDTVAKTVTPDIDTDDNELKITFKTTIEGSIDFQKFNQIYLTYWHKSESLKYENSSSIELFSRVAMDPVFIGADGTYSIYYSLYF